MVKLAVQHAWLDEKSSVEPSDVEYAFELMDGLWATMLDYFIEKWHLENSTDKEQVALRILEVGKTIPINDFYGSLCSEVHCQRVLDGRIAQSLEGKGYIQRSGEPKNRMITRLK